MNSSVPKVQLEQPLARGCGGQGLPCVLLGLHPAIHAFTTRLPNIQ